MTRFAAAVALLLAASACGGNADAPAAAPAHAPADASVVIVRPEPTAPFDPSGVHLDEDAPPDRPRPRTGPAARPQRPIDVILRSTPPGAIAAVDGTQLGPTPRYWQGDANGREHEFTFTMKGYAFARYRFVPITSGVVHARLTVITDEAAANEPPPMTPPLADVPAAPSPTPVVVPATPTVVEDAPTPLITPPVAPPVTPPPSAVDAGGGSARAGIGPQP